MAKELPYYKFEVLPYLTGDINLERWELQGIFNNICAFYWSRNCELTLTALHKKYDGSTHLIEELIELNILKVDDDFLSISFLNEQWASKETQKIVNSINGKLGGRPKKQPKLNQSESENKPTRLFFVNQDQNRNITNIEESKGEESKVKESKGEEMQNSDLLNEIINYFEFNEERFIKQKKMILAFVDVLDSTGQTDHFKIQFKNYRDFKQKAGYPISFPKFIGDQKERFENAMWDSDNWAKKLEEHLKQENGKETKRGNYQGNGASRSAQKFDNKPGYTDL